MYDTWKTGYYETIECKECADCMSHEQTKDEASEFLESAIDMIYGRKAFDKENLEFYLEECAHLLGLRFNGGEIKITSKKDVESKIYDFAKTFSQPTEKVNFL